MEARAYSELLSALFSSIKLMKVVIYLEVSLICQMWFNLMMTADYERP